MGRKGSLAEMEGQDPSRGKDLKDNTPAEVELGIGIINESGGHSSLQRERTEASRFLTMVEERARFLNESRGGDLKQVDVGDKRRGIGIRRKLAAGGKKASPLLNCLV